MAEIFSLFNEKLRCVPLSERKMKTLAAKSNGTKMLSFQEFELSAGKRT